MGIKTLLLEEIGNEVAELRKMELGSDEYKNTVDGVTKLVDRVINIDKLKNESMDKDAEIDLKLKEMEEERKDRLIKNSLTALGIIVPVCVTVWGTYKTIKFEETGTITTIMGRGFINKLLPKK